MLSLYPEIRDLYRPDPTIAVVSLSVAALQMILCGMMADKAWWFVLLW